MSKSKPLDNNINALLLKYIYASIKDIKAQWNGDERYPREIYLHYENFMDNSKKADYKAIVSVATEVKQIISRIFCSIVEEVKNTKVDANSTIETMTADAADANDECYFKFAYEFAHRYSHLFGPTLKSATDVQLYFHGKLVNLLEGVPQIQVVYISNVFNDFVKSLAFIIARYKWYSPNVVINYGFIAGTLFVGGIEQGLLDNLQEVIEDKAPPKKKPAPPVTEEPPSNNNNDQPTAPILTDDKDITSLLP